MASWTRVGEVPLAPSAPFPAATAQAFHCDNVGEFCNTIWSRNGCSSTMSAVAILVRVRVSTKGRPSSGTSLEGGVIDLNAGIC